MRARPLLLVPPVEAMMKARTKVLGWLVLAACVGCTSMRTDQLASDGVGPQDPITGDAANAGDGSAASEGGDGDGAERGDGEDGGDGDPIEAVVANPFVDTKKDPYSTFAADVDTASYDYFRQSVSLYEQLPEPRFVRIEDYVNFFDYQYETPAFEAETPFAISLEVVPHPVGRSTTLLRVGIKAKARPVEEKKPANLVFLVDTSGSMASEDKLPLVQFLLKKALDVLDQNDTLSIVTYAGDVAVRLGPTQISERRTIQAAIDGLESGGGTAGESGIRLAYQQAEQGFLENGINHVILCTDGDFNIGVSSDQELVALIRSQRDSGVTLTALGFGRNNLNDRMMEAVSNAGNGMYGIVYDQQQATAYAEERLLSTFVHVAKDMKIQVEFSPTLVKAYRLIGYENRAVADDDFRDDLVDGGEVGAEHRVTALYELVLAGQDVPMPAGAPPLDPGETSELTPELGEGELVRVKVRYKAPEASDADAGSEVGKSLLPDAVPAEPTALTSDLAWASAVAAFAERLRGSPYAAPAELDAIAAVIEAQAARDEARAEFASLFLEARALLGD